MVDIAADSMTNTNTFKGFAAIENNAYVVTPEMVNRPIKISIKAINLIIFLITIDNTISLSQSKSKFRAIKLLAYRLGG